MAYKSTTGSGFSFSQVNNMDIIKSFLKMDTVNIFELLLLYRHLIVHTMYLNVGSSTLKYFMQSDSHTNKDLGNRYFVRSLYFDNQFSSNFFEKVDGMKIRSKYRLRTYSDVFDKNIPIFLEMKGRINERTYKIRTKIKHEHLGYFLDQSKYISLLNIYSHNNLVIKNTTLEKSIVLGFFSKPLKNSV